MIKMLAQNQRQYGPCVGIFPCPYCRSFGEISRGRRRLWCPWGCVGWHGFQMMMKLLSQISAILAVSYGWEGSKINPIVQDLVGTGFWRQKPLVCTPYLGVGYNCSVWRDNNQSSCRLLNSYCAWKVTSDGGSGNKYKYPQIYLEWSDPFEK